MQRAVQRVGHAVDSAAHRSLLRSRCLAPVAAADVTRLFSHNADADRLNESALQSLPGGRRRFAMERSGPEALTAELARGCLSPETLGA